MRNAIKTIGRSIQNLYSNYNEKNIFNSHFFANY